MIIETVYAIRGLVIVALITGIAAAGWKVHDAGYQAGVTKTKAAWDAERAKAAQEYAQAQEQARKTEQQLQARIDAIRKERSREVATISRRHDAIVAGLRDRAAKRAATPSGVPQTAGAGVGCTGAGLARPDAEFLAGYAADAARLQSAFDACKTAYDSARRKVADAP